MKRFYLLLITSAILFSIVSCKGDQKPAENIGALKEKYKDSEFKSCDEFLTIDKALSGDEGAKKELEEFNSYINSFEKVRDEFEIECPDKFREFDDKYTKKLDEYAVKLISLSSEDDLYDESFNDGWDEKMSDEEFEKLLEENTEQEWTELESVP